MKKIYYLLVIFCILLSNSIVFAQPIINIPDAVFKSHLVSDNLINTNMDTEIDSAEAASYTGGLGLMEVGISDLTGIEAFINLSGLFASDNLLTTVDLSSNTQLTDIQIQYNQLSSFISSPNPNVTNINLYGNHLTSFSGSNFPNLNYLDVSYNQLNTIDIDSNFQLFELYCDSNNLSSLDLEPNYNLYILSCRYNDITNLDVKDNFFLGNLSCGNNPFTCLNLEGNYNLLVFECFNAPNLVKLNLKNANNTSLTPSVSGCPMLGCVQVDDSTYSATNWSGFPGSSFFSTNCGIPVASFTHNAPVCNGSAVTFDQTMTDVDLFNWDFGDGSTSNLIDPSHFYDVGGNYLVELSVEGCYGSDVVTDNVELGGPIAGYIDYSGGALDDATIILLKYEPFYTSFDTVAILNGFETAGYYDFDYIYDGQYIIKVYPTASHPELIPTYSGNQANWESATQIIHSCFDSTSMDISMLELPAVFSGPGSLSGEIIEGLGFGRAQGDPIHGVDVKLGITSSNIVATTTTDLAGEYSFTNVPFGTYTIYVDIPGLLKDSSYTLTIDSATLHWTYLDYLVDSTSIYIVGNIGIEGYETNEASAFNVYPNPVNDNAVIQYSITNNADVRFDVYNTFGVKMNTLYNTYTNQGEYLLNFNPKTLGLKSGVYFITCTVNNKQFTKRIIVLE